MAKAPSIDILTTPIAEPLTPVLVNSNGHDVAAVEQQLEESSFERKELENEALDDSLTSFPTSNDIKDGDAARKPMKNASRDRTRAELSELRKMVQDLEQQREELVEKLEQKELSKEKEASVWQTIADVQRQQRLQTEQENCQLKEALEQQLQMAKRLEEGIRQKRASEVVLTRPFNQKRSRLDHTMALLYSQHMRDIHRGYNQLDEIFEWANSIEHLESTVIGSRLDEHGLHQPYVELRERRWVPYEFSRVCDALWRATVSEYLRTREGVEAHCEPDSLVIRYDNINHKPERDGLLVGTVVMKKFMEPNRMILVWRGTTTAVEEQVDVWRRPFSNETGWVLVERDSESETPATRSRTCSRHYAQWDPESDGSTKRTPTRLRAEDFEKLVLGSTLDDMACIVEAFENILLDEDALSKH